MAIKRLTKVRLHAAFEWNDTPEGQRYWNDVFNGINRNVKAQMFQGIRSSLVRSTRWGDSQLPPGSSYWGGVYARLGEARDRALCKGKHSPVT